MVAENNGLQPLELWQAILISVPLCTVTLWIVVSNVFVIASVITFQSMRTPTNTYLASLAFTDLLVGLLILPLNIIQIVCNRWILNQGACKTWVTLDVTLSSLSILHLIAIAVDRYRAVSDGLTYVQNRTFKDALSVIFVLWVVCIWISTPPILGWGSWDDVETHKDYICDYSTTIGYVFHSSFGSFIFPMTLMMTTYWKIYKKIQQRLKERAAVPSMDFSVDREFSETETSGDLLKKEGALTRGSSRFQKPRPSSQIQEFVCKKIRFSLSRERRAARTLGIIIGAFLICWVPFCIMYMLRPLVGEVPMILYHSLTWLGYFNSAINPIIYCVYNKDFKQAFQRFVCCCKKTSRKSAIII